MLMSRVLLRMLRMVLKMDEREFDEILRRWI
jgi:hypothetical protein